MTGKKGKFKHHGGRLYHWWCYGSGLFHHLREAGVREGLQKVLDDPVEDFDELGAGEAYIARVGID
jgi:hypothetical protein